MTETESLPILRLRPRQQPVVWGGRLLAERLGKPPSEEPVGESWEVWEGDPIEGGSFAGLTLQELTTRFPRDILGAIPLARGWRRFPLLTKFIDANEPLSVQVHPDDAQAQRLEGQPYGKTEAWLILEAKSDAWIIHGLTREIDKRTFRQLLEAGTADELLRKVPAVAGETIFVPAGTVHAIGPGVLLHEVQQTSDVTYRLYDWNRQSNGSRRELHLDKGLSVSRLKPSPSPVVEPLRWSQDGIEVSLILASQYFTVKRVALPGPLGLDTAGESFNIVTVISGGCHITTDSDILKLRLGQSAVIPACFGPYTLESEAKGEVLVEYIDDVHGHLTDELRIHGFGDNQVASFLAQFQPVR